MTFNILHFLLLVSEGVSKILILDSPGFSETLLMSLHYYANKSSAIEDLHKENSRARQFASSSTNNRVLNPALAIEKEYYAGFMKGNILLDLYSRLVDELVTQISANNQELILKDAIQLHFVNRNPILWIFIVNKRIKNL